MSKHAKCSSETCSACEIFRCGKHVKQQVAGQGWSMSGPLSIFYYFKKKKKQTNEKGLSFSELHSTRKFMSTFWVGLGLGSLGFHKPTTQKMTHYKCGPHSPNLIGPPLFIAHHKDNVVLCPWWTLHRIFWIVA